MKIKKLVQSFGYALRGIGYAVFHERNFRIHIRAAVTVIGFGAAYGLLLWEWAAVFLVIGAVMAMELINTAVEQTMDLVTDTWQEKARNAKDAAAGAVLVMAGASVALACVIFLDGERWEALLWRIQSYLPWIGGAALLYMIFMLWFVFYFPGKKGE